MTNTVTGALTGRPFRFRDELKEGAAGMAVTPVNRDTTMTRKTEGGRSLAPHSSKPIEEPADQALRDPLALPSGFANDDPSVEELVTFRQQAIDLKAAARRAKELDNEEFRLWLARQLGDATQDLACSGLQIMSLAFAALTAIWPADHLDQAEAKLALAEHTGARLGQREPDFVSMMDAELGRRLRWKRTAFAIPGLMLPPAPLTPRADDRGLAEWPLERFDLVAGLPLRGGVPAFADRELHLWASFARAAPDLDQLVRRARTMFEISDRLVTLAARGPENASELVVASEGARIAGYLAAAQVMIWPPRGASGLAAKKAIVALINQRGEADDPVEMQAAIRHIAAEATWLKSLSPDMRERLAFDWCEIV